jgi:hypothetical protein
MSDTSCSSVRSGVRSHLRVTRGGRNAYRIHLPTGRRRCTPKPRDLLIDAFKVEGNVPSATVDRLRHGLAASLDADSCVNADVAPDPRDASYVVAPTISGPPDHLTTLVSGTRSWACTLSARR